jgi:hypothetical protein
MWLEALSMLFFSVAMAIPLLTVTNPPLLPRNDLVPIVGLVSFGLALSFLALAVWSYKKLPELVGGKNI